MTRRDEEARIVEIARAQHGLATRPQLRGLGLSRQRIDRRLAAGVLEPVHRGVYRVGPLVAPRAREMAALLAMGARAWVSHVDAIRLWRVADSRDDAAPVEVTVLGGAHGSRPGIRVHRVRGLGADERAVVDGIRVISVARTVLDLAPRMGRGDLERVIARAEEERLLELDDLRRLLARYPRRPGTPAVRALLDDVAEPALAGSEAEAIFQDLIAESGLPRPLYNARVGPYRLDAYWPRQRVAVEIDGYRYHGTRRRFEGDRLRATRLAAMGIQVIPVTWRQITRERFRTGVQIGQALVLADARTRHPSRGDPDGPSS